MSLKNICCIEIGGTSAAVAIANTLGSFLWKKKGISTAYPMSPEQAVKNICDEIKSSYFDFDVVSIASFGPLDLKNGSIGSTTKKNWVQFPLIHEFKKNLGSKIAIILESDVTAPAFSEYLALRQNDSDTQAVGYLTIGTGVGLGVCINGKTFHGRDYPEFGHISLRPHPDDKFAGSCTFHNHCIEGMISSGAIAKRLGIKPDDIRHLKAKDRIWDLFAYYIASASSTAAMCYSLDHIVVGGGIITADGRKFLYNKANSYCTDMMNGYYRVPKIVPPKYMKDAGLVGAAAVGLHPELFVKS